MADHVDITLWIDRRWKDAIEKHLRDETLEEHLEDVLDELCNHLPEREYKRISAEIYAEDAARRTEEEAARTYAAYHVTERGQEWYFKTSLGEELLAVGKKLRGYLTKGNGVAPDKFIGMFFGGQPITAKEFDALTALRMENTGKVRGVFDLNFDKRKFSAVHIMDGWRTWAMRDVSAAVYHATRPHFASSDDKWRKLLDHLSGKEITSAGHLSARNFSFGDEIIESDGKLNFYVQTEFDVDAAFGTSTRSTAACRSTASADRNCSASGWRWDTSRTTMRNKHSDSTKQNYERTCHEQIYLFHAGGKSTCAEHGSRVAAARPGRATCALRPGVPHSQ